MATTTAGMIVKIAVLALVLAVAIFAAFPLIEQRQWLGLGLLVLVTAVLFWVYLSPRRIPVYAGIAWRRGEKSTRALVRTVASRPAISAGSR